MNKSKNQKKILDRLYAQQGGICYYCGEKTLRLKEGIPDGKQVPWFAATLEHLYSRYDIRRFAQYCKNDNTVMCCRGCNDARAKKENELMKIPQHAYQYYDIRDLITNAS